ncbi:hypothetical protein [Streptomyces sp. ISL-94]|uniref:hypothetical protein n=1 Tax=Streptomyces sp. ISL-94 TaxID=2819190 RepID=UPI001BE90DBD|nr:hypothetical protein [Streptomyces sp. ISL-94]MBT2477650.1 hypothetical protein [Streptomyces sp. ISL-94]
MTTRTATSKPSDSNPFDFNLDTVEAEVDLIPFRVHHGGKRFEFAHLQGLDVWDLVGAAEAGDMGATLGLFRVALGDSFDDFRKVKLAQYKMQALFAAYQKHCGLEPGESEASGR